MLLFHITRHLVLVFVVLAIVSIGEAKTVCDLHLSRIRNMPLMGEPSQDTHYDALMAAGQSAVPCLIANVTNARYAPDPRPIPGWGTMRTTVGHRAVYMLWRMTNVDPIKMLPRRYQLLHKQIGVYALDEYLLDRRANRRTLQRKFWRWYRTTYLPYMQGGATQQLVGPEWREPLNCGMRISDCGFDFAPPGQL